MNLSLTLHPRRIAFVLAGISALLSAFSITMKHIEWAAGTESTYWIYHITQLFNVNREANIPTYYSALLLLACALLLGLITLIKRRQGGRYIVHWGLLTFIFLGMSVDEATAIHEMFTVPVQETLGVTGIFYFGWVLVGFVFVGGVGLLYLPFLLHLPRPHRLRFVLAGGLYVGGALFVEMLSANQWYMDGGTSLTFSTLGTIEELLEMLGAVVFIHALLLYISEHITALTIRPAQETEAASG